MKKSTVTLDGLTIPVYSLNTVVVGSGAAGLNAADRLNAFGQRDIAIVTESMNSGTSRNTGSDKQTYYKLTLGGGADDSVFDMAETLFFGGAMHGDLALVEAAIRTGADLPPLAPLLRAPPLFALALVGPLAMAVDLRRRPPERSS